MSIAKQLGKTLGGTWTFAYPCWWNCNEDKRHIARCSVGVDEFDNPLPGSQCWLYGDGPPRRAEQYMYPKNSSKRGVLE